MPVLVEVLNRAFAKLGAAQITDPAADDPTAQAAMAVLPGLRQDELRGHVWSFAVRRASLPAAAGAPPFGYARAFPLPGDALRLLELVPRVRHYSVEGGLILTDAAAPLHVRYLADVAEVGAWDASFAEVMACRLAMELGELVTQSGRAVQSAMAMYQQALGRARRVGAMELPPQPRPSSEAWDVAGHGDSWVGYGDGGSLTPWWRP